MPSPAERFLDAVSRPFSDNAELRIHIRRTVEERMASDSAESETWGAPVAALEAADRNPFRRRWRWWLWLSVLVTALACMFPIIHEVQMFRRLGSSPVMGFTYYRGYFDESYFQQQLSKSLSADQQLILFGDDSKGRSGKWKTLWERFPNRPDYYAQYASAFYSERSALPSDFLATAERIDPDNAWFPVFAAAVKARETVKSRKQTRAQIDAHVPREWDVMDEPRLAECLSLLHKASSLPRFDSYSTKLISEKLAQLPGATDFGERLRNLSFASTESSGLVSLTALSRVLAAKVWLLANQGDKEEFQRLLPDWTWLARQQAEAGDSILEGVIAQGSLTAVLPNLSDGAERLGIPQEASRLKDANQQAWVYIDMRRTRTVSTAGEMLDDHGSHYLRLVNRSWLGMVEDPPVPTASELTPGRMVDHCFFYRLVCVAVFPMVFLLCGACAIYRSRSGSLIRRLSLRLTGTLGPADWAWLFASVMLPLLFLILLYAWTPLGGKDWSLIHVSMVARWFQLIAWFLLTMATPVLMARWRLAKRLPGLAITHGRSVVLGFILAAGYAATAIAGIYFTYPHPGDSKLLLGLFEEAYWIPPDAKWLTVASMLLLPLLPWGLGSVVRALFTHANHALGRQMMTRLLVPTWIFLLLPMALLLPILKAQERYWTSRETLLQPSVVTTGFEARIVSKMKEQNLKVLRLVEAER